MNNMIDIFISYKREDADYANSVKMALENSSNFKVWWDEKLQIGKKWAEEIDHALNSAKVVVVIWSKKSVNSDWVKHEASFSKINKNLVQVKIDDCIIPSPFCENQPVDLRNWNKRGNDSSFKELLAEIKRINIKNRLRLYFCLIQNTFFAFLLFLFLLCNYFIFNQPQNTQKKSQTLQVPRAKVH